MSLWSFNTFFAIACIVMFCINIAKAERLMKLRYPELHFRESSALTVVSIAIKIILVSFIPILNLGLLYVLIFRDEALIEASVQEAYDKYQLKEVYDKYHKNDHSEAS